MRVHVLAPDLGRALVVGLAVVVVRLVLGTFAHALVTGPSGPESGPRRVGGAPAAVAGRRAAAAESCSLQGR